MILGSLTITARAVETHKDSYLLHNLSVIAVERHFLPSALIFGSGGAAFLLSFGDLLYPGEVAIVIAILTSIVLAGLKIARIRLLSRDLRGSELSGMIWGSYGHLNRIRREIVAAMQNADLRAELT